ncbi:hypothetical protein ACYQR9_15475 [Methylobacterium sp. CM6241]
MSVQLSKALLPVPEMSKKEKLRVMKARQSALSLVALGVLRDLGYVIGDTLKVPGAYGYFAKHGGEDTSVGIKTSADRWVGIPRDASGGWGLVSQAKEIFVVTFDDRFAMNRLQIIAFAPKVLIEMGTKVYARAQKEGQTGIQWIPLDEHANRSGTSMAAGHLLPHGNVVFDEPIEWLDVDTVHGDTTEAEEVEVEAEPEPVATSTPQAEPLRLTIPEAKAALARTFGVSPEAISITVNA